VLKRTSFPPSHPWNRARVYFPSTPIIHSTIPFHKFVKPCGPTSYLLTHYDLQAPMSFTCLLQVPFEYEPSKSVYIYIYKINRQITEISASLAFLALPMGSDNFWNVSLNNRCVTAQFNFGVVSLKHIQIERKNVYIYTVEAAYYDHFGSCNFW
jgi:hypothetical protein